MHRDFQGFALENEGFFTLECHLPVAASCGIVILSESGMDV